jgi:hypothetical protein
VLLGLAGSVYATLSWSRAGFGNLTPSIMVRIVLPNVLALSLGVEIILSSFFLSVLGIRRK